MTCAEVCKIDAVVRIDGHSSWPRPFWKRVFRNLHTLRINLRHFVCTKLTENREALAVDRDAVRVRIRRGRVFQVDFSAARIQSPDHVGHLNRGPKLAFAIKYC